MQCVKCIYHNSLCNVPILHGRISVEEPTALVDTSLDNEISSIKYKNECARTRGRKLKFNSLARFKSQ